MKLFWFADLAEKFQVYNSYTTHKFTKSKSSNFGLIEELMDLSDIAFIRINSQISHENAKWIYMLTQICFHPVVSMPSENSTIFLIVAYIFCLLPQFILIYSLKAIILFFLVCDGLKSKIMNPLYSVTKAWGNDGLIRCTKKLP